MAVLLQFLAILLLLGWPAPASSASVEERLADRILGAEAAPVTLIEYSSLTCPHCAGFHRETLPRIQEAYVANGKVRVIFRDFPLDPRALAASMIARCVDPDRYYGFLDLLFREQEVWARSSDPARDLKIRAQLAGLSEADANACLADQALAKGIEDRARQASQQWGIQSTPTFVVNDTLIRGAQPFEEFRKAIDAALGGHKQGAAPGGQPAEGKPPGLFGRLLNSVKQLWNAV